MSNQITETSIQEFLGLSDADMRFIDLKISLKNAVKEHRTRSGLTQKALAVLIDSSQSRVAKLEGGDSSVSIDLMLNCLFHLGVENSELASIICPKVERQSTQRAASVTGSATVAWFTPVVRKQKPRFKRACATDFQHRDFQLVENHA